MSNINKYKYDISPEFIDLNNPDVVIFYKIIDQHYELIPDLNYNLQIDSFNYVVHYLAYENRIDIIEKIPISLLINLIYMVNYDGDNIFHIGSKTKNFDLLMYLMSVCDDINPIYMENHSGYTPLWYIVAYTLFIEKLVTNKKIHDHMIRSGNETSLIGYYIARDMKYMVEFLLSNIEVNHNTDLMFHMIVSDNMCKNKKMYAKILLKNSNIDVNILNPFTPLIESIKSNDVPLVKFLIKNGADINKMDNDKIMSPLSCAIKLNYTDIVELLSYRYDIDVDFSSTLCDSCAHLIFTVKNNIDYETKIRLLSKIRNIYDGNKKGCSILYFLMNEWKLYSCILANHKLKIYSKSNHDNMYIDQIVEDKSDFFDLVFMSYVNQLKKHNPNNFLHDVDIDAGMILSNNDELPTQLKNKIMDKIIHDHVSYPKLKNKITIEIIDNITQNFQTLLNFTEKYIQSIIYLMKKYPVIRLESLYQYVNTNKCFSLQENMRDISHLNESDYIKKIPETYDNIIIWINKDTYFLNDQLPNIIKATEKKYPDAQYMIYLFIIIKMSNISINPVLINLKNKIVERFNSYKLCAQDISESNLFLKSLFGSSYEYKYYSFDNYEIVSIS